MELQRILGWRMLGLLRWSRRHALRLLLGIFVVITASSAVGEEAVVPQTLDEAFAALNRLLEPAEIDEFRQSSEFEATARAHGGIGMYIRNEWLRHGGSQLLSTMMGYGAQSFDDVSGMILTSYWRHLNNEPIEIEKQGKCHREWREEMDRLMAEAKAAGKTSFKIPGFTCH